MDGVLASSNFMNSQSPQHFSSTGQNSKIYLTSMTNSNTNNNNNTIHLSHSSKGVPSIKSKTNELFYKWLAEPERTEQLKEVINIIRNNNRIPKFSELKSFKNVKLEKYKIIKILLKLVKFDILLGFGNAIVK